jgi:hypothetical protein
MEVVRPLRSLIMRTERMPLAANSVPDRDLHLRLWVDGHEPAAAATEALQATADGHVISLELFDVRRSTDAALRELGLASATGGRTQLLANLEGAVLRRAIELLTPESFGAWVLPAGTEMAPLLEIKANRDRAAALPENGAFFIFSLYDENIEVFARGECARRLEVALSSKVG